MPIYTDKVTGRFFVQFRHRGQLYKRRMPEGSTKEDAKLFEIELKHTLHKGSDNIADQKDMLWESFLDTVYLEHIAATKPNEALKRAIIVLRDTMPYMKGKMLRQIKAIDVERFIDHRTNTPTKHGRQRQPATVARELAMLSAVFSMAVRNDLCSYNPVSRVNKPIVDNVQDKILHIADEAAFLAAFRYDLQRDIAATVIYTGLRQKDVLNLRKNQVSFIDDEISLIQGKTKRRVKIPLFPLVREILLRRLDNDSDLFFPSYRKTGQAMSSIRFGVRHACIRAGLPIITIRDLRRTFGTRLHENGVDDMTVAGLLGHSGLRSVHRYKRGTEIKRKAILSLGDANDAKIDASTLNIPLDELAKVLKTLVESRGIEPLTSAMPLQRSPS